MKKSIDVFCEISCLTEASQILSGVALQKKWFPNADKRVIGQYLQKFINYNIEHFNFLGVKPFIIGTDQQTSLCFRSSEYIGTIPLRSCDTGKQIGDFVVSPRFTGKDKFEDYIEILNLLDKDIAPDIKDSLPLVSGRNFRPPLYLEAIKFISSLEKLLLTSWRKFDSIEKILTEPTGQVNWNKYLQSQYKIENRLKFPSQKNILSELHNEYAQIRFVFDVCKLELLSSNTPLRIKSSLVSKISFIEHKLYDHKPKLVDYIIIKASDSVAIKECKTQANIILKNNLIQSTSWRINFSDVFEKFTQHIFKKVALETGGRVLSNYKIKSTSYQPYSWELKHLEPDGIYQKEELVVFIDAKYKSHLYNKFNDSKILKDDHRHDLHQILAYSSFSKTQFKYGFLCYPSVSLSIKEMRFKNAINEVTNTIVIMGIPLEKNIVSAAKKAIINALALFSIPPIKL